MARRKKIPFLPWTTATKDGIEQKGYIRLGGILEHPEFIGLSSNAKVLYIYMLRAAKGKRDVEFPRTEYSKLMTAPTFRRARDELIEAGFIELLQANGNLRKPNLYRFSTRWNGLSQK